MHSTQVATGITAKVRMSASEFQASSILNVQLGTVHVITTMPCYQLLHEANSSMRVCFNDNDAIVPQLSFA